MIGSGGKYHEEHKVEIIKKSRERYQQNKEHYCEKHVCETCGGNYITSKKAQHTKTKLHQNVLANVSQTCFHFHVCGGRYTDHNKSRHLASKKHQISLQTNV